MEEGDQILKGILLRLVAIFALSTMGALIKLAESGGAHIAEMLFFRQLFALPMVLMWLVLWGPGLSTIRTNRIGAHMTRTAIGLGGMIFNFAALVLLPLAEATTLSFTVPIFATILAAILLREQVGIHRWGAVLIGFTGILVVAQPGSGHFPLIGAIVGIIAALLTALVTIYLRQLSRTESTGSIVFWFSLLSLVPLGIAYAFTFQMHDGWVWMTMIAMGVMGGIGQLALTAALKLAPVSVVLPMDYSSLLWATLYGFALFGVLPTVWTWIGAPLIIASGLYIVWRERVRKKERAADPAL